MRIAVLGTGVLATSLATAWTRAGHDVGIAGRSSGRVRAAAQESGARAHRLDEVVAGAEAVLLAVHWAGVADVLTAAGAPDGSLAGLPLLDPVNAVEHGAGVLQPEPGRAFAEVVAGLAPGAHVVKAFHLFPAATWTTPAPAPVTVAMCGDDPGALAVAGTLVRAAGGVPAVVGGLTRARQLEEAAGFVIALAFAGVDPRSAVPAVPDRPPV